MQFEVLEAEKLLFFIKEKIKKESLSNKKIKKIIELGLVKVNDKTENFASKVLKKGDLVFLEKDWNFFLKKSEKPHEELKILYEDEFLIIINKPSNLISEDVLKLFEKKVFLVNRLDKLTSGAMILSKSLEFKKKMVDLFSLKKVKKEYIAIVDKKISKDFFKIESYISKKKQDGKITFENGKKGKYALTYIKKIKATKDYSSVKCIPITGRTHQIRLHLKKILHPILGDFVYCLDFFYKKYFERILLHSYLIEFVHPILKKKILVKSSLPKIFKKFLDEKDIDS